MHESRFGDEDERLMHLVPAPATRMERYGLKLCLTDRKEMRAWDRFYECYPDQAPRVYRLVINGAFFWEHCSMALSSGWKSRANNPETIWKSSATRKKKGMLEGWWLMVEHSFWFASTRSTFNLANTGLVINSLAVDGEPVFVFLSFLHLVHHLLHHNQAIQRLLERRFFKSCLIVIQNEVLIASLR